MPPASLYRSPTCKSLFSKVLVNKKKKIGISTQTGSYSLEDKTTMTSSSQQTLSTLGEFGIYILPLIMFSHFLPIYRSSAVGGFI